MTMPDRCASTICTCPCHVDPNVQHFAPRCTPDQESTTPDRAVENDAPRHMPCDKGCQPDWHRDDCAIYLPATPDRAASTDIETTPDRAEAKKSEPWCCPECRAEGWVCRASCGRACCVSHTRPATQNY